jgi:hypothetical protein
MPLLTYFGWVGSLAAAKNARAEIEQGQKRIAVEWHDPVEAFKEMGRETVEGCLQSALFGRPEPGIGHSAEAPGRRPLV